MRPPAETKKKGISRDGQGEKAKTRNENESTFSRMSRKSSTEHPSIPRVQKGRYEKILTLFNGSIRQSPRGEIYGGCGKKPGRGKEKLPHGRAGKLPPFSKLNSSPMLELDR